MPAPGIIAVFAKPPRAGEAKTRLGAAVGHDVAARLARAFFEDTWHRAKELPGVRLVLASTANEVDAFGVGAVELWLQGEGDLGARLERIAARALAEAPWFVAIGADSPGLPLQHLEAARAALLRHEAVLGPSADGGFYLLGLRSLTPGLLDGLPWSAPTTFEATRSRLLEQGWHVATLQPWYDVDEVAELERLRRELAEGSIQAPRTAAVLASLRQD